MNLEQQPHRRFNLLTGEWTLVSPHRSQRPWQGRVDPPATADLPQHDPNCYLCPGNARAGGERNPDYAETYVFDNDFPALLPRTEDEERAEPDELLYAAPESGRCRVICFSPRHDLTLARMPTSAIRQVVDLWAEEHERLAAQRHIGYVQIFENRGELMGCSNPHPHGQLWATEALPNEPERELNRQRRWWDSNRSPLLADYLERELHEAERVVCANSTFVVLVPFWAVWPFETLILPRRPLATWSELEPDERDGLADILKQLTVRYDNLFETSFPYSMGFHPAPTDDEEHPEWVFHAHFYPPLLRSASVQKFMVGFEMLGTPQRDITPEAAAAKLRALPKTHYLDR